MAGSWIKLRTDLATDPAVIRLGALLKLDAFAVMGRLAAVWVWADTHADCHGCVTLVSRSCLDAIAQCDGFGAAMESVGWLISNPDGDGITFPRFERHMGEGAKARAQATKRKKNQRIRASEPCHARVTLMSRADRDNSVTREEKRREEDKDPPKPPAGGQSGDEKPARRKPDREPAEVVSVPPELDTAAFREVWSEWLAARREKKNAVTARAARMQFRALVPLGPVRAAACVAESIANDWTGIFPERVGSGSKRAPPPDRGFTPPPFFDSDLSPGEVR